MRSIRLVQYKFMEIYSLSTELVKGLKNFFILVDKHGFVSYCCNCSPASISIDSLTCPKSSLSLLLILLREARLRGGRRLIGRRKQGRSLPFVFLLLITPPAPFGHASRVPSPASNVDSLIQIETKGVESDLYLRHCCYFFPSHN